MLTFFHNLCIEIPGTAATRLREFMDTHRPHEGVEKWYCVGCICRRGMLRNSTVGGDGICRMCDNGTGWRLQVRALGWLLEGEGDKEGERGREEEGQENGEGEGKMEGCMRQCCLRGGHRGIRGSGEEFIRRAESFEERSGSGRSEHGGKRGR